MTTSRFPRVAKPLALVGRRVHKTPLRPTLGGFNGAAL